MIPTPIHVKTPEELFIDSQQEVIEVMARALEEVRFHGWGALSGTTIDQIRLACDEYEAYKITGNVVEEVTRAAGTDLVWIRNLEDGTEDADGLNGIVYKTAHDGESWCYQIDYPNSHPGTCRIGGKDRCQEHHDLICGILNQGYVFGYAVASSMFTTDISR